MSAVADSLTQGDLAKVARSFNVWLTGYKKNWCDGHSDARRISADINDDENAPTTAAIMVIAIVAGWSKRIARAVGHCVNSNATDAPIRKAFSSDGGKIQKSARVPARSYYCSPSAPVAQI